MLWDNSLKAVECASVLHLAQHICHFMLEQRTLALHASVQRTDGFSAPLHAWMANGCTHIPQAYRIHTECSLLRAHLHLLQHCVWTRVIQGSTGSDVARHTLLRRLKSAW